MLCARNQVSHREARELAVNILITGANGFIGKRLSARLLEAGTLAGKPIEQFSLLDVRFDEPSSAPEIKLIQGSISAPETLSEALSNSPSYIFHLACVPGGAAEENYGLGLEVNLRGTLNLLEELRARAYRPAVVYTSSIGIYGELPPIVEDETPAKPTWTYGTHKLIGELLMGDYSRRGWVDSRTVRLPAIVVRPPAKVGAISAFMSDIIRELAAGRTYISPVSADATAWWMSVECCIDNLLHAASLPSEVVSARRRWMLPALRFSIGELVEALAEVYGSKVRRLVSYAPVPEVEERFGRLPPLHAPLAEAAGFRHDGDIPALLQRALRPDSQGRVIESRIH